MFDDVMIDCETLGVSSRPVILSIAAVKFNRQDQDTVQSIMDNEDRRMALYFKTREQTERGHIVETPTLRFWISQKNRADQLFDLLSTGMTVHNALTMLNSFVYNSKAFWSLGAADDLKWLHSLYDSFDVPFFLFMTDQEKKTYRKSRCCRTIFDLIGSFPEMDFTYVVEGRTFQLQSHDALHDCIKQVLRLQYCYRVLNEAGIGLNSTTQNDPKTVFPE